MSMIMVPTRMCDNCNEPYSNKHPAWMTLTFPNVETDDDPEFDFCTYECLQTWVNEEDEETVEALTGQAPQPTVSLAEALAQGLRPGNPIGG